MKNFLLIGTIIFYTCSIGHSQTTLPNGDFEFWSNTNSANEEPIFWNGNKTGGGFASFGPQTCFRESSGVHSGTYCLKLQNSSIFGSTVNATATTGRIEVPSTDVLDSYIHTLTDDSDFNSTFTGRPDSLVGWFKFTQGGNDIGRIQATLHDDYDVEIPDQGSSETHIIGEALFDLPSGNSNQWTRFSVPFTYNNEDTPSYILLIAMASTNIGGASTNTILWVDDLSVIYSSVSVMENEVDPRFKIFPNPTRSDFTVDLGTVHNSINLSLLGLDGKTIRTEQFQERQLITLNIEKPAGVYLLKIVTEQKTVLMRLFKE